MTELPRAPRLDPDRAVDAITAAHGIRLTIEGRTAAGEVGAAYVRYPDGRRGVLGIGDPAVAPMLIRARAAGIPVASYDLVTADGPVTYLVQTRLPGGPPTRVDRPLVTRMLEVNDRCAGLLADRSDLPARELFLDRPGPGFCLHESLARRGPRTARLLDRVREIGRHGSTAPGDDLVHMDFHPANTLERDGTLTGVVDWDGAGRGDRRLDLVTLRFDLALRAPGLAGWFDRVLADRVPVDLLRRYWAHMSLRMVDWAIRHHGPAEVDFWLDVSESGPA